VTAWWRKLHDEELHGSGIIRMIKEDEMCKPCSMNRERAMHIHYLWEKQKEKDCH
jgi:hypothetical protein